MSKGLEALERLHKHSYKDMKEKIVCFKTIEKELKDFEWLKSKINIDFFYQLPSDDRVKLAEILGVKL